MTINEIILPEDTLELEKIKSKFLKYVKQSENICYICNKDLGDAEPVKSWGKDAHFRCVENKRIEFMKEVDKAKEDADSVIKKINGKEIL